MMIVVLLCRWCNKGRPCRSYATFGAIGMPRLAGSSWQRVFAGHAGRWSRPSQPERPDRRRPAAAGYRWGRGDEWSDERQCTPFPAISGCLEDEPSSGLDRAKLL